jgi:hypothetical protein
LEQPSTVRRLLLLFVRCISEREVAARFRNPCASSSFNTACDDAAEIAQ